MGLRATTLLVITTLAVGVGHAGGLLFHWYEAYPMWYDALVHLLGGAWVALAALALSPRLSAKVSRSFIERPILALGATAFVVGLLWEGFEFTLERALRSAYNVTIYLQPGLLDTIGDIVADTLGGLAAALTLRARGGAASSPQDPSPEVPQAL